MAGAIVDVGQLERFQSQLKAYNDRLKESRSQLLAALEQLGDSWNDSQRQKFDESMQQAAQVLSHLSEKIESQQLPYLRKKIQAGRAYLGG